MIGFACFVLAGLGVGVGSLAGYAAADRDEGFTRAFMAAGLALAALAVLLARSA